METRADILNELKEISPILAAQSKANVFSVPHGYFDSLHSTIVACIKEESGNTTDIYPTDVPKGYFDNLANSILGKIKAQEELSALDELKTLSPVLFDIQHKNVFEVPANYFATLSDTLPKTTTKEPTKIISLSSRIFKYAVAAMLTGVVALGVYQLANKPGNQVMSVAPQALAKLDPIIEKGKSMNDQQFNETLNNLSEEAIASYLNKNGNEKDVAVLASSIDEKALPNQDDYLLDEKTLENYLSKTNN